MDLAALLQGRDEILVRLDLEEQIRDFLLDLYPVEIDGEVPVAVLTESQLRQLYLSSLYEMEDYPLLQFLEDQFGPEGEEQEEEEWDEAMLVTIRAMAMRKPDEIEFHVNDLASGNHEEDNEDEDALLKFFLKRLKRTLGLPESPKTTKVLLDSAIVRHLELAALLALRLGPRLESLESNQSKNKSNDSGFNLTKEMERWSDALSIHYAIDVKPSAAFSRAIIGQLKSRKDTKGLLVEMLADACGLDDDHGDAEEDAEVDGGLVGQHQHKNLVVQVDDEVIIPATQTWPHPTTQRLSQPSQKNMKAMSPITLNSHWSRLKSKTLRRRSTDTDLSRLVDLPPVPPRLSQTRSNTNTTTNTTTTMGLTPKRKGVLVRVGDLSPSKLFASQESLLGVGGENCSGSAGNEIVAWETPVKAKRGHSQMTASGSQSTTQPSDFTSTATDSSLVILDTPPRASIGAAESRVERFGTHVPPFKLFPK